MQKMQKMRITKTKKMYSHLSLPFGIIGPMLNYLELKLIRDTK